MAKVKAKTVFMEGVFTNNPILVQMLGICSTLAVTSFLKNTVVMSIALIFVCGFSSFVVSSIRKIMPMRVRMMVEILIIASGVIMVDIILQAYFPDMSRELGPYVGLIITNCIVMGRCEAFALANPPVVSAVDGMAQGLGYGLVLSMIAIVREIMGSGSLWGFPLFKEMGIDWQNWAVMVMAPGAFFVLAIILWIVKGLNPDKEEAK